MHVKSSQGNWMEHQQVFTVYFISMLQSLKLQCQCILSLFINFGSIVSAQELVAE